MQLALVTDRAKVGGDYKHAALEFEEKLQEKKNPHLYKWRKFVVDYLKSKGKECYVWFDTSAPYDNEVAVRIKGHHCWLDCFSLRFDNGELKAYDSHFGQGTSFVWNEENPEALVTEILDNAISNCCCRDEFSGPEEEYNERFITQILPRIKANGWIITEYEWEKKHMTSNKNIYI